MPIRRGICQKCSSEPTSPICSDAVNLPLGRQSDGSATARRHARFRPVARPGHPLDLQTADDKKDSNQQTVGSNDRLFYALPNFQTVETTEQLPPLTVGQKFKLQARSQFDYFEIPWYGILAGISQARNTSAGYGQGASGYAKRYASEWGDGTIENFMVGAVFASALRQDPRYYVLGKGSFWHRAGYAISCIVVTRSDSGQAEFNSSQIFGGAVAAGISTYSYHPRDDRNLRNVASVDDASLATFPEEFCQGMAERAQIVGTTGRNHPEYWVGSLASPDLHAIVVLFARDVAERQRCTIEHQGFVSRCAGVKVFLHSISLRYHLSLTLMNILATGIRR